MTSTTSGASLLWATLATPLLGCLVLAGLPAPRAERLARPVLLVVTGATLAIVCVVLGAFDFRAPDVVQLETNASWAPALDLRWHLGVDGISLPLVALTALLTFLCGVYTTRIVPRGGRIRVYAALILLLEVGMLGTFVALDLVLFFLFFEVVLIPMWFLIARWGDYQDRPGRTAAANLFILYTLLGSAVMLIGFLFVHAETGTFDMVELAARGGDGIATGAQTLAAVAIVGGLAIKVPMWPLHSWLPDAHTKAPTVASVLLAGVLLKMGTYGIVRTAVPVVPEGMREIAPWLGAFGVAGIVYGSLACLAQRDLKRMIAYSSVAHMGFVLLGIASMTRAGINGALFANIGHGLITGLLFFLAGAIKDRHGTSEFERLGGGLYVRAPRLGALFTFAAVASLGLPGLAGFWGEVLALFGAFRPDAALSRPFFLVLMAFAGVGMVLTALYLLRAVRAICQGEDRIGPALPVFGDVSATEAAAWLPLVGLIVLAGLWPALLLETTGPAVRALLGGGP